MITIRQDTREQSPLKFECETIITKLDFADYSCVLSDGFVVPVVFERKSVNDLFGTLSNGYDRFKCEIIRCQEANFRMVLIIEGTLTKVSKGIKHSKRCPNSLLAQVFTLWCKYGIFPIFAKDPEEASKYITLFYQAYEKKYLINKNKER